ncbi:hypothetical protein CAPTEDRAFT_202078 [Capitella teleta]|uniref:BED-type domain-containing protein n=1 Tax=Capitella teleta TaxID=283909 RepID=R7T5Y9_CAPTE|nr:hypothetical protein CAPTEDRAFT_202078 [Capitella teleta]|eukprot:ELT88730.1 hypothetical protein CAPTEDRAFT_202078 [Capitella teleta]
MAPKGPAACWKYFSVCLDDDSRTECSLCKKTVSRDTKKASYSTSPLNKHLKLNHPEEAKILEKDPPAPKPSALTNSEDSAYLERLFELSSTVGSYRFSLDAEQRLCKMIAVDMQPYSIVSSPGFQRFVNVLQPRYDIPSRNNVTQTDMPYLLEAVTKRVREKSEVNDLKDQVKEQGDILKVQSETIKHQQAYMEGLDRRERGKNVIMFGVLEDAEKSDETRVGELIALLNEDTIPITTIKRLGVQAPDKRRPTLITLPSMKIRDKIVNAARTSADSAMDDVKVKKDMHPSVRKEWHRLLQVKENEEKKAENVGREIAVDCKKRQVTCDGQVIDA